MLHRRISTATDMKFPMYLVPLAQLERLYGGKEPRYDRIEAHQEFLSRGELVRWIDLPVDSVIIFMSHEHVLFFFTYSYCKKITLTNPRSNTGGSAGLIQIHTESSSKHFFEL